MENKKVTASLYQHNIPLDIWSEILANLPVKSLVRFRCVSKSWQSLIDDPDFCHLHLNRFKNNSDETHLFVVEGLPNECVIRCSETFNTTDRLGYIRNRVTKGKTYKNTATPGYDGSWDFCYSIDGLIFITGLATVELLLWNPSIRKCRLLPQLTDISSVRTTAHVALGLGFDQLIRDYKLVMAVCHDRIVRSIAIYTVGTNSWKTVKLQLSAGSFKGNRFSDGFWHNYPYDSVYFMGCLYFVSRRKELVSFDLSSEVFTFANLPAYFDHLDCILPNNLAPLVLVDDGFSLAAFHFSYFGGSIWALEDPNSSSASLCWTKRYTFTMSIHWFYYLKKNGDLLFCSDSCQLKSYNIKTRATKFVSKSVQSESVCCYKESLILLK